jgi:hypothetical protein
MADGPEATPKLDFNAHRESAITEYKEIRPLYEKFAETSKKIKEDILNNAQIKYHSVQALAKGIDEFGKKAAKPLEF